MEDQSLKLEALVNVISRGIQQHCQCLFTTDYIIYERLTCSEENSRIVVFQGWLNGSNTSNLVTYLEKWVSSEPTVVVLDKILQVGVQEASQSPKEEYGSMLYFLLGAIFAFVLLMPIVIVTIVCSVKVYKRRHKR